MRTKRRTLSTFLSLGISILCISGSRAGPFKDPMIPDGQFLQYRYTSRSSPNPFLQDIKKGEEVEGSSTEITSYVSDQGHKVYHVTDHGTRKNGYSFEHVSELIVRDEGLESLSFVARDFNRSGRTIRQMQAVFDDPTVRYPQGTFPVFSIVQAMRGVSFEKGNREEFTLWLAPTEIFRMLLVIHHTEEIEVPAGRMSCHYLEMKPDIRSIIPVSNVLANLIHPFLPEYRFWFSTEPSHPLVRFEGTLGGAGAAKHIVELKKVETRTDKDKLSTHAKEARNG